MNIIRLNEINSYKSKYMKHIFEEEEFNENMVISICEITTQYAAFDDNK